MTAARQQRRSDGSQPNDTLPPAQQRSWLGWAARVGYAACGVVYIAIGAIAAAVAAGVAERPGGAHQAMMLIERQPFGQLSLIALSIGLLGYAALNLAGAFRDPQQRGRSAEALLIRAADAITGGLYVALSVAAVRIAAAPSREGGRLIETWAAGVLRVPGGGVLLGLIGVALVGACGFLMHRARTRNYEDILDRRALSATAHRLLPAAARFGTLVRAVVLGVCGVLVIEAAVTRRPDRVGDVGDALSTVETTPFGAWLLGVAAIGFISYGVYQLAKVRYRRVPISWV